ncbi:hypothetical protein L873DRAFT_1704836 [Choiromyces venosus 120613-1]|uniref:Glutamate--tRNA ligase, mitochondrial n=1 Tax=Choiromyces venosus 120613-1 TaxID=1336337 RepID=A0A3N4J8B6_9PEZI|nr:hypothetical protein L873DRAFT_1704836 [Choiromyces venosus 120613-1]
MAFIFPRTIRNSSRPLWLCRRCISTSPKFSYPATHGSSAITPARTRFAPSPTGYLHLGSLRTALFNYLLAKRTGGKFLLRIEDTDKKRTVEGAEEGIFDTLRWAGLHWDEGPLVGGEFGPYRQSERTELHKKHVDVLLEQGHAYRCYCTPQRLEALALTRKHSGQSTDYDRHCLNSPPTTSVTEPHVVRLKTPDQYPPYHDLVYGTITTGDRSHDHSIGTFEDPILLKSDGMPTYHLANVVDDHFMNITHVVRATEWMPSTPKHVHLYNCFGWTPPNFVHVGLLQDTQGRKLSKRTGDVFVSEFREKGYLPEALNNFVALMGWSHAGESDVLDMQTLVEQFSIDGLTRGNTKVDFGKLDFLQERYVRNRVMEGSGDKEILDAVEFHVRKEFGEKYSPYSQKLQLFSLD